MRRILAGLALGFAGLVAAGVHGFSLPAWHGIIDGSPESEVLLGTPRLVRADDWAVHLPLAYAQAAHDPAFPRVNRNVGAGTPMALPLSVPIASPLAVFQPTLWGFFLGNDVGTAWLWWSRALGLFGVWLLVFGQLTGGRIGLSAAGSAMLLFSPFLQFWSLNAAPLVAFGGLVYLTASQLAVASSQRSALANSAGLGWAAGCYALAVYPAYQVVVAQLVAVLLLAFAWQRREQILAREQRGARVLGLLAAGAVALLACVGLAVEARDAIEALRTSAYPGARVSAGGGTSIWQILGTNLWIALQVEDYAALGNIAEASSFWLFAPVLAAALAVHRLRDGRALDPVLVGCSLYAALLWIYCSAGFPEWLARATGLSWVPSNRAVLGLGLADAVLLLRFASREPREVGQDLRSALPLALGFGALLAVCAWRLGAVLPDLDPRLLGPAILVNAGVALALLRGWRPTGVVTGLALVSLVGTGWFNPLVRGGSRFLVENPLSREILAIDARAGGTTRWLMYHDSRLPNLFRVLGVECLNGTLPVPQPELWRALDPEDRFRGVHNRYATAMFRLSRRTDAHFLGWSEDAFDVLVNPALPAVRELGVTHVLLKDPDPTLFERVTGFERIFALGDLWIYRLPPATETPGASPASPASP